MGRRECTELPRGGLQRRGPQRRRRRGGDICVSADGASCSRGQLRVALRCSSSSACEVRLRHGCAPGSFGNAATGPARRRDCKRRPSKMTSAAIRAAQICCALGGHPACTPERRIALSHQAQLTSLQGLPMCRVANHPAHARPEAAPVPVSSTAVHPPQKPPNSTLRLLASRAAAMRWKYPIPSTLRGETSPSIDYQPTRPRVHAPTLVRLTPAVGADRSAGCLSFVKAATPIL